MKLQGKTALVTGAAGGIGAELCRQLIAGGANVAAIDVDESRLQALRGALGPACLPITCDIRDAGACAAAVDRARARFGGIDLVVNNAGISHHSTFATTDTRVLERVMDVNFWGAVHMTRAALDDVKARRGVIVVVSSVAGFAPLIERSGYAASKHALHGLFDSLAAELRPAGVDVVMVCPSFVRTDMDVRSLNGRGAVGVSNKRTVGRPCEPEQLAAKILTAVRRRKHRLVPSAVGKLALALSTVAPGVYERLMVRSVARPH